MIVHALVECEALQDEVVTVRRVEIDETISRRSTARVEFTLAATLDPSVLMNRPMLIGLADDGGTVLRMFSGLVAAATELASTVIERTVLRVELTSLMEALSRSADFRIFQDATAEDIVRDVLTKAGVAADAVEFRCDATLAKRSSKTQYGSTHQAFVEEVLGEDGLSWFARHEADGPGLCFGKGNALWQTPSRPYTFKAQTGLDGGEFVSRVERVTKMRPASVTLRDHDFTKPALDLTVTSTLQPSGKGDHYVYPGGFSTKDAGQAQADALSQAMAADADVLEARGSMPSLSVGQLIELSGTGDAGLDAEYVVLAVHQEWVEPEGTGNGAFIRTIATMIEHARPYVSLPRAAVKAVGETGRITTPPGEEIHCDEHGRVKLQFHWDRYGKNDDKSSTWLRVTQLHTSGSIVIPRNGWEVLVDFEEGCPDRGVIVGRLYNAAAPPTDALPAGKANSALKSFSTPGGDGNNEVRLQDSGGAELLKINAQKDHDIVVANDKTEKVTTSASTDIGGHQKVTVGGSQTETVASQEHIGVGGDQTHKVSGARSKTISGDESLEVGGARSTTIGGNHTTLSPMTCDLSTKGNLTESVAGMALEASATEVGLAVMGSCSISVGAVKVEAVASGKNDVTVGAKATTIGGAFVNVAAGDIVFNAKGTKATAVGGAWLGAAGGDAELSSSAGLRISVGGAIAFTGAKIVMKVGSSSVTIAEGGVVFESPDVKFTASAVAAETSAAVGSK